MTPLPTLSPTAHADLVEIGTYIAQDNPKAAAEFVALIWSKCALLAGMPGMGRADPSRPGRRIFPVRNYVILYKEVPGGIEILRILHGRRDRGGI